jgi:hypothetical protein
MPDGYSPSTPRRRLLIFICVALLLAASTVQAVHVCGLYGSHARVVTSSEDGSASSAALCPLCLLAQSTTAAIVLTAAFLPLRGSRIVGQGLPVLFPPSVRSFGLYVRPPPFA